MGDPGEGAGRTATVTAATTTTTSEARSEIGEQTTGLLRAAHPGQSLLTGLVLAGASYAAGRPLVQALLAGLAVLVVQAVLGLLDDAGDAAIDAAAARSGKPVAEGRLPVANARFIAVCLTIVAVPLSLRNGWAASVALLAYLLLALLSRTRLRSGVLSWLPWAASFAVLPAYVAYGGDGAGLHGGPPTWSVTAAAAAVGVGVHFLLALPDLVADNRSGIRHLPLRIALRVGATRLLVVSVVFTLAAVAAMVLAVSSAGLRQ